MRSFLFQSCSDKQATKHSPFSLWFEIFILGAHGGLEWNQLCEVKGQNVLANILNADGPEILGRKITKKARTGGMLWLWTNVQLLEECKIKRGPFPPICASQAGPEKFTVCAGGVGKNPHKNRQPKTGKLYYVFKCWEACYCENSKLPLTAECMHLKSTLPGIFL